jgi:hypothetical protein
MRDKCRDFAFHLNARRSAAEARTASSDVLSGPAAAGSFSSPVGWRRFLQTSLAPVHQQIRIAPNRRREVQICR